MKYLYLDDAGDQGHTINSSKHYLWAGILTENNKRTKNCMKNARRYCAKKMNKNIQELKYPIPEDVYIRALNCLQKPEFSFHCSLMVKKDYISVPKPNITTRSFISALVENILKNLNENEKILITIDDGLNDESFEELKRRVIERFPRVKGIEKKSSETSDGIQAAHLIANSIFKKYEHNQSKFYKIYSNKIGTLLINPKIKL